MALKKINIKDLRLGMFVSELDISWVKSPFFRHRRLIMKQEDIELLKQAGVESLVIDISKSKLNILQQETESKEIKVLDETQVLDDVEDIESYTERDGSESQGTAFTQDQSTHIKNNKITEINKGDKVNTMSGVLKAPKVPLKQEFKVARRIQNEVLQAVDEIQNAFENGRTVSAQQVNPIIEKTLESIDNNSQAIMALLHEGRESGKIATHSFGVFALVLLLSSHLGYSLEDQYQLGLAALTHDAGWTKLPKHLMSKGKPYTVQEQKLVKQHIAILKKMLEDQPNITEGVVTAIEQHHEYLDGSGYPAMLKGDDIHPWARLLSTCNEYDEMVHGLGEHPGMTPQNSLSSLFQLSKKDKLDRFFTTNLISLLGVYPLGSAVELDTGQMGVVVEIDHRHPLKPTIKVFYEKAGVKLKKPLTVILHTTTTKIKRVLDIFGKDAALDREKLLLFSGDMLD